MPRGSILKTMGKNRLKCPECHQGTLETRVTDLQGKVRGENITIASDALVCPTCGFKTIPRAKMGEFALRVADGYRENHGLLTSAQIKDRRADLGMTQQQFANYIGVGVASVKRWELGQIQDEAMNTLILLKTDLQAAEANVAELSARLGKPTWPVADWSSLVDVYCRSFQGQVPTIWEIKDSPKLFSQLYYGSDLSQAWRVTKISTESPKGESEIVEAMNAPPAGLVA